MCKCMDPDYLLSHTTQFNLHCGLHELHEPVIIPGVCALLSNNRLCDISINTGEMETYLTNK